MSNAFQSIFLGLAKNKGLNHLAKKHGLKMGATRFVAGKSITEMCSAVKKLNEQGIFATVDYLGEYIQTKEEAIENQQVILSVLEKIVKESLEANVSIKLTSLGLDFGEEFCYDIVETVVKEAKKNKNFVRIDMEDYAHNEMTIRVYERLVKKYKEHVGLVIQSYLYKSEKDISYLQKYKCNLRICKGAYKESDRVAFAKKEQVDANYLKLVELQMEHGCYVGVATHDETIISFVEAYTKTKDISKDRFEFQMLYGIRTEKQLELAKKGYTVRAYVPFGDDWYGYFMRRLAERPANMAFILKSFFKK
ncbi:proline dehydrogenase [Priestia megaterium]|nr:proline dehydrogenase [Priestia megaterium]